MDLKMTLLIKNMDAIAQSAFSSHKIFSLIFLLTLFKIAVLTFYPHQHKLQQFAQYVTDMLNNNHYIDV